MLLATLALLMVLATEDGTARTSALRRRAEPGRLAAEVRACGDSRSRRAPVAAWRRSWDSEACSSARGGWTTWRSGAPELHAGRVRQRAVRHSRWSRARPSERGAVRPRREARCARPLHPLKLVSVEGTDSAWAAARAAAAGAACRHPAERRLPESSGALTRRWAAGDLPQLPRGERRPAASRSRAVARSRRTARPPTTRPLPGARGARREVRVRPVARSAARGPGSRLPVAGGVPPGQPARARSVCSGSGSDGICCPSASSTWLTDVGDRATTARGMSRVRAALRLNPRAPSPGPRGRRPRGRLRPLHAGGPVDETAGPPTQMAVFSRSATG